MSYFLIFYLAVSCLMYLVVFLRLMPVLPRSKKARLGLAAFILLMIAMPVLARIMEMTGHHQPAEVLAWIGFPWMGFGMIAFALSVISFLVQGIWAFGRWAAGKSGRGLSRPLAWGVLLLAGALCVYGSMEATSVRMKKLTIVTDKLPRGWPRLRIAVTSDLHLGLTSQEANLRQALAILRAANPAIWLDLGDLVDGRFPPEGPTGMETKLLAGFNPPLGKYCILGNHEFYAGIPAALAYEKACGFTVLRGRALAIQGALNLGGVDDPGHGQKPQPLPTPPDNGRFSIIMVHRPAVGPKGIAPYDLQLSGHTHGGQIFPYSLLVKLVHRYLAGLYDLPGGGRIYTTRGTGYWGPPVRVLAPPEVTIIDLVPPGKSGQGSG